MDEVPTEIACMIVGKCDFPSLVRLRKVNRKWLCVSSYVTLKRDSLDLKRDVSPIFSSREDESDKDVDALLAFLSLYSSEVRELKINAPSIRLSCSHFIRIAQAMPLLESLEVEQDEQKQQISYDVLYSLQFFKSLRKLRIKGWQQFNVASPGCGHRPTIPIGHLLSLEAISLNNTASIIEFLSTIDDQNVNMKKLREIEFVFTEESFDSIRLLTRFFDNHLEIRSIVLRSLRFPIQQQVQQFLRVLESLREVRQLHLDEFEFPLTMDHRIVNEFIDAMRRRRVHLRVQ